MIFIRARFGNIGGYYGDGVIFGETRPTVDAALALATALTEEGYDQVEILDGNMRPIEL